MTTIENTWCGKRVIGEFAEASRFAYLLYSEKDGFRIATRGSQLSVEEAMLMSKQLQECLDFIKSN